jgi:hypothetical protein
MSNTVRWREIPDYEDYEVSSDGRVTHVDTGNVEPENVMGSKAYLIFRKSDGLQFLARPSELMMIVFPELSAVEAIKYDHFPRTLEMVLKEREELDAYYFKRSNQLTGEFERLLKDRE